MYCFSENEGNSYRLWNPKTQSLGEARSVVFIETPLLAATASASTMDFTEVALDYVSIGKMLKIFSTKLLLYTSISAYQRTLVTDINQVSAGDSLRWGVLLVNNCPGQLRLKKQSYHFHSNHHWHPR